MKLNSRQRFENITKTTMNFQVDEKISDEIKKAIDFNDDVCDTLDMVICVAGDAPAVRNPFYYVQGLFKSYFSPITGFFQMDQRQLK